MCAPASPSTALRPERLSCLHSTHLIPASRFFSLRSLHAQGLQTMPVPLTTRNSLVSVAGQSAHTVTPPRGNLTWLSTVSRHALQQRTSTPFRVLRYHRGVPQIVRAAAPHLAQPTGGGGGNG